MYPPVSSELIFPVEAASAKITWVRPLPGMDHGMAREVVLLREALPAHLAVERLLAAVGPHVIQELAAVTEPTPANVTRAGLLPVGCFHVDADSVPRRKALAANVTGDPPFALCVRGEVGLKLRGLLERDLARGAGPQPAVLLDELGVVVVVGVLVLLLLLWVVLLLLLWGLLLGLGLLLLFVQIGVGDLELLGFYAGECWGGGGH